MQRGKVGIKREGVKEMMNECLNTVPCPMAESFVAVCDTLLKFHNLSAKFAYNFNE